MKRSRLNATFQRLRSRVNEPKMISLAYQCFFIEKVYKELRTDNVAQHLLSLGATNVRNQRKMCRAVNSPHIDKERTLNVDLLVESF